MPVCNHRRGNPVASIRYYLPRSLLLNFLLVADVGIFQDIDTVADIPHA